MEKATSNDLNEFLGSDTPTDQATDQATDEATNTGQQVNNTLKNANNTLQQGNSTLTEIRDITENLKQILQQGKELTGLGGMGNMEAKRQKRQQLQQQRNQSQQGINAEEYIDGGNMSDQKKTPQKAPQALIEKRAAGVYYDLYGMLDNLPESLTLDTFKQQYLSEKDGIINRFKAILKAGEADIDVSDIKQRIKQQKQAEDQGKDQAEDQGKDQGKDQAEEVKND